MSQLFAVVTTIQPPTAAMHQLAVSLAPRQAPLIVVGDKKGPAHFELEGALFFDLATQIASHFELARSLPIGHYTRKNLGYLEAIQRGAGCIYETDDDNAPLSNWAVRQEHVESVAALDHGWVNVYRCFGERRIWPRGFPLDALLDSFAAPIPTDGTLKSRRAPIQQGLANGSPDVDAIWRLVLDAPFDFTSGPSVALQPGAWCPFNSQSTWWWPDAFPLLYLPSFCSFRMTDIWRSFIAQRCLWALDLGLVFHAPEVVQDRNQHDLMRDFADEVPGYLQNRKITQILQELVLPAGVDQVGDNLLRCYQALVEAEIFPEQELGLVSAWLADLAVCRDA